MEEHRFIVSSVAVGLLGFLAARTALSCGWACHYVREMLLGVGLYLVVAALLRLAGPLLGVDRDLTRELTGWLALAAFAGLSQTWWAHRMFHRFLHEALEA
jgi:hypothetical protein